MLFYAQVHHVDLDTSRNAGAVGILWAVAQQTSLRDIHVKATGSVSGLDVGYSRSFGYTFPHGGHQSCGGGGTVNNVTVVAGQFGVRVSASQWYNWPLSAHTHCLERTYCKSCRAYIGRGCRYLDQVRTSGQTKAGVLVDEAWAIVMLDIQVAGTPFPQFGPCLACPTSCTIANLKLILNTRVRCTCCRSDHRIGRKHFDRL